MIRFVVPALAVLAAPAVAQVAAPTAPAPATTAAPAPADPAVALTDKEKSMLTRCTRMTEAQRAQSSKCSAVMIKAGKADPATQRLATPDGTRY